MKNINCKHCDSQFSKDLEFCPQCGCYNELSEPKQSSQIIDKYNNKPKEDDKKPEDLLNIISTIILVIGVIGGIVCLFNSFPKNIIDRVEFQPVIFAIGLSSILFSLFNYAFCKVIIQILLSVKQQIKA